MLAARGYATGAFLWVALPTLLLLACSADADSREEERAVAPPCAPAS